MDSEIATSTPVSQSKENGGGGDSTIHFEAPLVQEDYETASESDDILSPVGKGTDLTPISDKKSDGLNSEIEENDQFEVGFDRKEEKDENFDVKPVEAEEESPVSETVDKIEENGKVLVEIEKKEEGLDVKSPSSDEEVVSKSTVLDEEQFESGTVDKRHVSITEANVGGNVAPKVEEEKKNELNVVEVDSVIGAEEENSIPNIDAIEKEGDLKPIEDVLNVTDVKKIDSTDESMEVAKEENVDAGESVVPLVKEEKENESDEVEESEAIHVEEEKRSAAEKEVELKAIEEELDASESKNVYGAVESIEVGKEDNAKVEESVVSIVEQEKWNESDIIEVSSVIEAEEENESATNIDAIEKEQELKPIEVDFCANDVEEVDSVVELNDVVKEEEENVVDEENTKVEEVSEVVDDAKNGNNEKKFDDVTESKVIDEREDDVTESKVIDEREDDVTESKVIDEREDDVVEEESKVVFEALDAIQNNNKVDGFDAVEKDTVVVETKKDEVIELETEDRAVLDVEAPLTMAEEFGNAESPSSVAKDASNGNAESIVMEDSKSSEESPSQLTKDSTKDAAAEAAISHENSVESTPHVEKIESAAADDDEKYTQIEEQEQQPRVAILDSSELAKQLIKEMGENSSRTSFESSKSYQNQIDGQIVTDSDEEGDSDEEDSGREMFDSAALAALLKAATGGSDLSDGNITITSQDGARVFSMDRPAGLGSSAPSLRPGPARSARPTLFNPSELVVAPEPVIEMDEEERKLHENVEQIRVKFLRLISRLGCNAEDSVAAQVLYRLSLAEGIRRGRQTGRAFSVESAKKKAMQLEEQGDEALNFSCNILVLGKTGVGKSAIINSIFNEEKSGTNAFQAATTSVREISGVVNGVEIRVIDTPGLKSSVMDQPANRKILSTIKKYTKKCHPDIVLYVDRLDTQTRDFNDLPLLKSITAALGSSIWFSAIVALTHAASAPSEGPDGSALSYEVLVAQRSHVVQHSIRQAAGDMRLMNPVALVENHPSCRRNREGERVLPNGVAWRSQMLLLCCSSKILAEANSLLKLQQDPSPGKLFGFRVRSPPLPYLLSTLLQTRTHPKLTAEGDNGGDSDVDLDDFSDDDDVEDGEEDEYDSLPPFKPLKKSQLAQLSKEQKRAYLDEYDYRVKLLQKKQLKEEIRRLREAKKRGKSSSLDFDQDNNDNSDLAPAAIPVPMPDMVLPPSFDSDFPTYRYRFLEPTSQLLTRPVLDPHGWDHDCGYDGVSLEESLAIASRFPAAVAVQITKDKKDFSIHLDSSVAAKHGGSSSSLAGFDIQTVGKQLAYTVRGETKFKNLKRNKTTAGVSVTFLGENVATGLKVEDQLTIGKRVGLVGSAGAIRSRGDVAYGANFEARLKEKDNPIGQAVSTLGLSLMKWRGDLAIGANLQTQANIGRSSKVAVRVSLNNKRSGQITVRTSSSEQLQLALLAIIPVVVNAYNNFWPGESEY